MTVPKLPAGAEEAIAAAWQSGELADLLTSAVFPAIEGGES